MKYKQNLVSGIKKEIAFEKEQELLKEKHHIEDPDIVVIEKNNFFNNTFGKTINYAIDIGLRAILPDLIENQVIDIKNSLLNNGNLTSYNFTIPLLIPANSYSSEPI